MTTTKQEGEKEELEEAEGEVKNKPPREEHKIVVAFLHSYHDNALHGFMDGMSKLLVSKLLDILIHGNVLCAEYKNLLVYVRQFFRNI